jgi:seryl-tRNA synthetase
MNNACVIELPRRIDGDLAADVAKQAVYVSSTIKGVRFREDQRALLVDFADEGDPSELGDRLRRFVDAMTRGHRAVAKKVVARRERLDRGPLELDAHAELVRRGWVIELGRGQLALAGPALRLARAIDGECQEWAEATFDAAEQSYPSLIPASILARCGYFGSFPHAVSFVGHFIEDFDRIEAFREANASSPSLVIPNPSDLAFEACLTPAVCYHTYQGLEGKTIGPDGLVITSVGKCYRYESGNLHGLERLWDFTMREVVFVGTMAQVTERREKTAAKVLEQLARWDLEGSIESANDPFFPAVYAKKRFWQEAADLKLELRLAIGPAVTGDVPRAVAAGSFNSHDDFFGAAFRIQGPDGQPAFTSCAAWGLERWVLACFAQHGFEPRRWPAAVRETVFGRDVA